MSGYPMIDALNAAHLLTPREKVDCVACEGRPAPENNPCAVCGRTALASGSGDHAELGHDIRKLCVGHPHAKIAWPHYELHALVDRADALIAENAALRAESESARTVVAWANNSLFGSCGYFHGEPYDDLHLARPIEVLKARATEAERKLAEAEAEARRWKSAYDITHEQATENVSEANALRGKLAEAVVLMRMALNDMDRRVITVETANRIDYFLSKEAERG